MKYVSIALCGALMLGASVSGVELGVAEIATESVVGTAVLAESPYSDFVFTNGVITEYVGSGGDVVIPSFLADQKVVKIGDSAFLNQSSVTSVVLPEHLQEVERMAFFGCSKLEEVVFPSGLSTIGEFGFTGCISLKGVDLPSSLEEIGRSGFSGSGLVSVVVPNSVKTLGASAFSGCLSLEEVYLGHGLSSVPSSGFSRCSRLHTVVLGSGVRKIETGAFQYCRQLTAMGIPSGLSQVESGAFQEVEPLGKIYYTGNYAQMMAISMAGDTVVDGNTLSNHGFIYGNWIFDTAYPMVGNEESESGDAEHSGGLDEESGDSEHFEGLDEESGDTGESSGLNALDLYDVAESDWYYPYVALVYERGYMGEVSQGNFRPAMLGTRGMIAQALYQIGSGAEVAEEGENLSGSEETGGNFADVSLEYTEAVTWCFDHGVMMGISEDMFGTVSPVTREQFALVLRQLAGILGDSGEISDPMGLSYFLDVSSVSHWAEEGLVWAVEQGLMKGFEGNLNPQGSVTRSEMAVMLYQFVHRFL